jgi:MerR family copper efflux transcriptional regulator
MQIGEAAREAGVSPKMIRHYEAVGLLPRASRRGSGYRDFSSGDVTRLRFIARARALGFPIERIRSLVALWEDRGRSNAEVKAVALAHMAALEEQISHLRAMAQALQELAERCHGDGRADCPILEGLTHAGGTR